MRSANGCVASIDGRDPLLGEPAGESLGPAEAADVHLALRQPRPRHAPRERRDHGNAVPDERGGQLARLARAAEHEHARRRHGAAGRSRACE